MLTLTDTDLGLLLENLTHVQTAHDILAGEAVPEPERQYAERTSSHAIANIAETLRRLARQQNPDRAGHLTGRVAS